MADLIIVGSPLMTEGEPLWWIKKLEEKLDAQLVGHQRLTNYYDGKHRMAFASAKFQEAFGGLFSAFADNWCDLVVDATEERLNVTGFRIGDVAGDQDAWRMWQANGMDLDSQLAHTEALIHGRSAVLVWAGDDRQTPSITVEHPTQMIVATSAGNRRRRLAALKRWINDDGYEMATLYLPDKIWKFQSRTKRESDLIIIGGGNVGRWVPRDVAGEMWPLHNPLGFVPVFPLENRPRMLKQGVSEIVSVIPKQDAINKLVADMLVASEFSSFRQRWATGFEIPKKADGTPLDSLEAAVNRLWYSEKPEGRFGTFEATDLENFVKGIEMLVQHVASQTRTPPHYFYLRGEFPSGESIKSAETGLVAKVHRKMRPFGETWEDVVRAGFAVLGDKRSAAVADSETMWGDPETRSEAELVDAVTKKQSLGVPWQQLMEDLGYSPTVIQRMKGMRRDEARELAALATESGVIDPEADAAAVKVKADAAGVLIRSGFDPEGALAAVGLDPIEHKGLLPVTLQSPDQLEI